MKPHASHARYETTLEWTGRVKPDRAILTNMHVTLDYRAFLDMARHGVDPREVIFYHTQTRLFSLIKFETC